MPVRFAKLLIQSTIGLDIFMFFFCQVALQQYWHSVCGWPLKISFKVLGSISKYKTGQSLDNSLQKFPTIQVEMNQRRGRGLHKWLPKPRIYINAHYALSPCYGRVGRGGQEGKPYIQKSHDAMDVAPTNSPPHLWIGHQGGCFVIKLAASTWNLLYQKQTPPVTKLENQQQVPKTNYSCICNYSWISNAYHAAIILWYATLCLICVVHILYTFLIQKNV